MQRRVSNTSIVSKGIIEPREHTLASVIYLSFIGRRKASVTLMNERLFKSSFIKGVTFVFIEDT